MLWRCLLYPFLCLIVFAHVVARSEMTTPRIAPPEIHANKDSKIQRLWESKSKSLNPRTNNYPKNKLDLLLRILRRSASGDVQSEFERVRSVSEEYAKMSEYDQTLLQAFVADAAERKDKSRLVDLLSRKCQLYIGAVPIEVYLRIGQMPLILIGIGSH
jgi:hypothetical protein